MSTAKSGDKVRVHYTGKLSDGEVFDSSKQGEPLEFTLGQNEVITGFEQAIEGMLPGDVKKIEIRAEEAYGARDENRIFQVSRDQLPPDINEIITVGEALQVEQEDDTSVSVIVTELTDSTITLDANHPLAGSDLTFELELVEIV